MAVIPPSAFRTALTAPAKQLSFNPIHFCLLHPICKQPSLAYQRGGGGGTGGALNHASHLLDFIQRKYVASWDIRACSPTFIATPTMSA